MIIYKIEYEHLIDDFIKDDTSSYHFNRVKDGANKYRLELSDDDFKYLFKLSKIDIDVEWIMSKMSNYKITLMDTMISYMTY